MKQGLRLFAALGPGDIVEAQRKQLAGTGITHVTAIIFSGQLFEFCRQRGIQALFTGINPNVDELVTPTIKLRNVPRLWERSAGWRFHVSRMVYAVRLAWMARQFRADFALIDSGSAHFFALAVFKLVGIPVAINFHNVRWAQGFERCGRLERTMRRMDTWFFRYIAAGATGCSAECGIQARSNGAGEMPYYGWCGQFAPGGFSTEDAGPPDPLRILFAGRVERNKGVFDLIEISRLLKRQCKVPVMIEVCGDGDALPELRLAVQASQEIDRINLRGKLERPALLEAYGRAHAVIVPTRGDFREGMPLVCAEAVLSGRPIITSVLSNALPGMGDAIVEAKPEDPASYVAAISRLAEDRDFYEQLRSACPAVARQFLDRHRSYPAAVDRLMSAVLPAWKAQSDYDALFESASVAPASSGI
jgi:glycogen synthase